MKKYNLSLLKNIHIIGGQWRGRKLIVSNSQGLRPTLSRVRETLFNWLSNFIVDARCLDCFAGSGALGLEALSRHAASVTFLEIEYDIVQNIWNNLVILKALNSSVKVINTNALVYLSQSGTPHEVVFIDPPFRQGLLERTINLIEENGWLFSDAMIFVESESENSPPKIPTSWNLYRAKIAGQVSFRLYRRKVEVS